MQISVNALKFFLFGVALAILAYILSALALSRIHTISYFNSHASALLGMYPVFISVVTGVVLTVRKHDGYLAVGFVAGTAISVLSASLLLSII